MPGTLHEQGLTGFTGKALLRRNFGYPGRIDSWERVWLTMDDVRGAADIRLNGHDLGRGVTGRAAYDVTQILGPRNQLEIDLTANDDTAGLAGEVALEVRALAYLADVEARRLGASVEVTGGVEGECAEPLDLYALIDRRNVHYQTVSAGERFSFQVQAAQGQIVRVELVWRSQIWYAVEVGIPG